MNTNEKWLVVLNYTTGVADVFLCNHINPSEIKDFNYESFVEKEYNKCEVSWMIANKINIGFSEY